MLDMLSDNPQNVLKPKHKVPVRCPVIEIDTVQSVPPTVDFRILYFAEYVENP